MKKKTLIIIVSIILVVIIYLAVNWKPLLLRLAGFQHPKIENAQTVQSWSDLKTKHDWLAVATTKTDFNYLQENIGVPGILVFDKDGTLIVSNRGEGCQVTARNKLKDLGTVEFQKSDNTNPLFSKLDDLLARVSIINKSGLYNETGYDYTVVYTWAKYLPAHSSQMMEAVNEGLSENKAKVLLISLNLDYIDTWASGNTGDKIDLD